MAIKHSKELIAALEFQVSDMGVFHGAAPPLHSHGHILESIALVFLYVLILIRL
jgi:hypothetical protein